MAHLAQTPTNMSSIGEVCDRLGKTFLMSLLGNLSATGGLRVNSSSVKGGLINFPLFLLEGNAILSMTSKADYENIWLNFPFSKNRPSGPILSIS